MPQSPSIVLQQSFDNSLLLQNVFEIQDSSFAVFEPFSDGLVVVDVEVPSYFGDGFYKDVLELDIVCRDNKEKVLVNSKPKDISFPENGKRIGKEVRKLSRKIFWLKKNI